MGCGASVPSKAKETLQKIADNLPSLPYQDLTSRASPLDMLFFQGTGAVSDAILEVSKKEFGEGDWSHVGIVVTTEVVPIKGGVNGRLYVWESTMSGPLTDGVPCVETDKPYFGVQIRDLEAVLHGYLKMGKTKVGWAQLKNNPFRDPTARERIKETLSHLYHFENGARYDANFLRLFSAMSEKIAHRRKNNKPNGKYFCSEWVAHVYQAVGVFPSNFNPELMAPQEFLVQNNSSKDGVVVEQPIVILPS